MKKTILLLPLLCMSLSGCNLNSIIDSINDIINSFSYKELSDEEFEEVLKAFDDYGYPDLKEYQYDLYSKIKFDDEVYEETIYNVEFVEDKYFHSYQKTSGATYKETLVGVEGQTIEKWYFINNGIYTMASSTISSGSQEKYYKEISKDEFDISVSIYRKGNLTAKPSNYWQMYGEKENVKRRGNKNGNLELGYSFKSIIYIDGKNYDTFGNLSASFKEFKARKIEISGRGDANGKAYSELGKLNFSYSGVSAKKPNLNGFEKK